MKKIVILAAVVALGACSQSSTEPAPADSTVAEAPMPVVTPSPNVATAGTYEVTSTDGTVTMETLSADGTYVDMTDGEQTDSGTWRVDGDKSCFTPASQEETCYTAAMPDADGNFAVMGPDGTQTATAKRPG